MDTDLESFRDIPGYKAILKAVLKSQIQHLVEQLSSETDEESIILTASISDGTLSHLGSVSGKSFINGNEEIKSQFLGFCLKEHHAKEQRRESPRADQSKPTGNSSLSSAAMMSEQYGRNVKPTQKALMSRSGKRKGPYSRVRPDRIVGSPSNTGGSDKLGTIKIEPIDTEFDRVNVDSNREIQSTSAEGEFYEDNVGTVATDDREDNQHETNVRTDQDFNTQSTSPEPGTSGYKVEFSDPDTDFNISGFDLGDSVGSPEKWKQESANLNITDEAGTSADVDHSSVHTKMEPLSDASVEEELEPAHGSFLDVSLTEETTLSCETCGATFKRKDNLKRHMKKHSADFKHHCSYCNVYFNTLEQLLQHKSTKHGSKHLCPKCGKLLETNQGLRRHLSIAHDATCSPSKTCLHLCPFSGCGAKFVTRTKFVGHMNIHTGSKPYSCRGCGKTFADRYKKNQHEGVCTGKISVSCHHCSQAFSSTTAMKAHIKTKHLQQSYPCQCGKVFAYKSGLTRHKKEKDH